MRSTLGTASTPRAAGAARRAPSQDRGPATSENTGSVSMVQDDVRRRNVEWPTQVAATPSPLGAGGKGLGCTATCAGHGVALLVIFHLITSRRPRSAASPGLKKVFPLK